MATNIELIFRDFVMNKIKEIEDEGQHSGVTSAGHPNGGVPHSLEAQGPGEVTGGMENQAETRIDPAPSENSPPEPVRVCETTDSVKGLASKEESETTRKKNKKHKRHKSKKKKKKRKEEKGSSSESGLESDGEARNQPSVKTEVDVSMEGRDVDHAGAVEKASRSLLIGDNGEGRTKKEKRRTPKKKKKKSRKRDEKMAGKSPPCSPSGSTSVSGTESEMDCSVKSRLLPTMSPVVTSDTLKECSSSVACPNTQGVIASSADTVSGEDSSERKDFSTMEGIAAEHEGNQECKPQELPDIIPKLESTHREDATKGDLDTSGEINRQQDRRVEENCGHRSRSRSKSRSPSKSKGATSCKVQVKKSHSQSCSPKRLPDKPGSRKAHTASKRRSRSASKRKSSPKRKRSRSDSRRRKSRSRSVRRSRRKSRSLSAKRRPRSKSRSKSLSRRNHSRSRSWRSRSHRRNRRSLSRSTRRTRRSRSQSQSRRRRSRSRSVRRTRRARSRSIVILRRRSRSQRNRRSTSVRRRRSRTRSPKRRQSKSQSPRQSRRSKSRSKSRSLQQRKHSKSRSPGRCHRSKSKSPKCGRTKSKTPKRENSKSRSPARKESKSRSISRDGQSSERCTSPNRVEVCSKPVDLTSPEMEEKRVVSEKTDEEEVTSKEICSQSVNMEGHSLKAEAPFDFSSHETGEFSALEQSADHSEKHVLPMGSWKPVPPLVDSKMKPSIQEVVTSATIKGQGDVMTNLHENKSPPNGEDEKSFSAKMPLINPEVSEPIAFYTASHDTQPKQSSEVVSEDGNKDTECRPRSVSPQNDRLCEPIPSLDRSAPEESDDNAFMEKKTEVDMVTPHDCGSSRSRSPVKDDGECSKSYSPLTEEKPPATKNCKSPLQSKKHKSSKQRQPSKSPTQKKHSKSRSPSRNKRSNSRSPSSQKRSRSTSTSQKKQSKTKSTTRKKSKSKSPTRKRKSKSPSRSRKKKSKSKSPSRKRRSRSKSAGRKRRLRSRSRIRAKHSQSRSPKRKRSRSKSPTRKKRSKSRSPARRRRSKSADKSKRSKSRSPARRRRSRSRARRSRSRRSQSSSRRRRSGFPLDRRDRWKRTPSHSPVLILRKRRSTSRPRRSSSKTPPRLTELDKDQLLEIAKANAAAMCAKAGMPIPESLRPKSVLQLPLQSSVSTSLALSLLGQQMNLPMGMANMPNMAMNAAVATMNAALSTMSALTAMPALPSITNKPPPSVAPNTANIEEVKRKVTQKANSISIKELTEKCKKIAESKEEMAIAKPHVSDDEDDEKPFAGLGLKENKGITFSLSNSSAKPVAKTEAAFAKEFPVSSGSQHRKKEGEGAYGEWVPVDKKNEKTAAATAAAAEEESKDSDSVFPDAPLQPVDITLAVSERAAAQKRLAENPFDVNAICMLSRAQEQVDAWAQSNTIPGLFTGSTGAQVLSSEELSTSGPQAWIKKDQFLRAAPVSGGVGEFLMRKMGWRVGEGLGKYREGTVEPIVIDFKTDRKGLVAEGEKTQKSGSLVVMKDLLGKHPVSALMEMCNKKKWAPPEFVMVHDSGPDHRKNFLFKVMINGSEYQPQTASPNKKHAKAMAATVALQAMGEVSGDNVYSGPVFTAATTTG
ncbi:hypothetical protein ANANG_G00275660 [Anguilla anguilla]|uniref:Protein SON-like n=1 Tax=Anguilla anguilla TaxID=7936 RepID=A0A9D3RMT3_ANGAN|nr:hypothetical protein ANANG_G00275660 [Anguilla anguilla]